MFELKGQSDFNSKTKKGGPLSGDGTLRTIKEQLQNILTTPLTGGTGAYTILSSIGIATQQDGSLKVDDTKLSEALNNNFNDVSDLFTSNYGTDDLPSEQYGVAERFQQVLDNMTGSYIGADSDKNGLIATSINSLKNTSTDIDNQIATMELRMTAKETNLKKQFTAMELLVSSLQTQGNSLISMLSNMSY
jgi:flagellar hook-associated protein 2